MRTNEGGKIWLPNSSEVATATTAAVADNHLERNENRRVPAKNTMGKVARIMCRASARTSRLCISNAANTNPASRNPVRAVNAAERLSGMARRRRKMIPPAPSTTSKRTASGWAILAGYTQRYPAIIASEFFQKRKSKGVATTALTATTSASETTAKANRANPYRPKDCRSRRLSHTTPPSASSSAAIEYTPLSVEHENASAQNPAAPAPATGGLSRRCPTAYQPLQNNANRNMGINVFSDTPKSCGSEGDQNPKSSSNSRKRFHAACSGMSSLRVR